MNREKDPFAEGADAFLSGRPETANPYDLERDLDAHCLWNDGWAATRDADEDGE